MGLILLRPDVLFFLADESPDFIHLQSFARQVAQFGIHQSGAALADTNAKPHDRIAMNARHAFDGADARAFAEIANDCDLRFGVKVVGHIYIVIRKLRVCQYFW